MTFDRTTVDKVSDMPEVADFVPELVCLGIDVAICGVISPEPHLDLPQNYIFTFYTRACTRMLGFSTLV